MAISSTQQVVTAGAVSGAAAASSAGAGGAQDLSSLVTTRLCRPALAFEPVAVTLEQIEGLIPVEQRSELASIILQRDIDRLKAWVEEEEITPDEKLSAIEHCVEKIPHCASNLRIPAFHLCIAIGFNEGFELLATTFLKTTTTIYEQVDCSHGVAADGCYPKVAKEAIYYSQELLCDHRGNTPSHYAALMQDEKSTAFCEALDLPYTMNDWQGLPSDIATIVKHPKEAQEILFYNTYTSRDLLLIWWKYEGGVKTEKGFSMREKFWEALSADSVAFPYKGAADGIGGMGCVAARDISPGEFLGFYSGSVRGLYPIYGFYVDLATHVGYKKNPLTNLTEEEFNHGSGFSFDTFKDVGVDPASGPSSVVTLMNDGVGNVGGQVMQGVLGQVAVKPYKSIVRVTAGNQLRYSYDMLHPIRMVNRVIDEPYVLDLLQRVICAIQFNISMSDGSVQDGIEAFTMITKNIPKNRKAIRSNRLIKEMVLNILQEDTYTEEVWGRFGWLMMALNNYIGTTIGASAHLLNQLSIDDARLLIIYLKRYFEIELPHRELYKNRIGMIERCFEIRREFATDEISKVIYDFLIQFLYMPDFEVIHLHEEDQKGTTTYMNKKFLLFQDFYFGKSVGVLPIKIRRWLQANPEKTLNDVRHRLQVHPGFMELNQDERVESLDLVTLREEEE